MIDLCTSGNRISHFNKARAEIDGRLSWGMNERGTHSKAPFSTSVLIQPFISASSLSFRLLLRLSHAGRLIKRFYSWL
jgi:hypothetical protein